MLAMSCRIISLRKQGVGGAGTGADVNRYKRGEEVHVMKTVAIYRTACFFVVFKSRQSLHRTVRLAKASRTTILVQLSNKLHRHAETTKTKTLLYCIKNVLNYHALGTLFLEGRAFRVWRFRYQLDVLHVFNRDTYGLRVFDGGFQLRYSAATNGYDNISEDQYSHS